jgi:signal peptidase I
MPGASSIMQLRMLNTGNNVNLHSDPFASSPVEEPSSTSPISTALPEFTEETTVSVEQPSKVWAVLREIIETILLAAIIWLAVNFATARYVVDGQSMEPNLHTGQFLIVSRLAYRFGDPQRGDIIVFDFPGNPSDDYVKRIIGLPGETVTIENGHIFVNGQRVEEPYLPPDNITLPSQGRWTVPDGEYFVLGDNRAHSSDSRSWGMLEVNKIIGKAWISYWPPQTWGLLPHYDYNSTVP